jgi:alpha-tubulin suppressor-like RCC1 family protein
VSVWGAHTFCEISCGGLHIMAKDNNNYIWMWGINHRGMLGIGNTICKSTPIMICNV